MSEPNKAVFLSYASQDAEAAKRIADALRAAGVEVWFDQSELVGGDAWDAKIRKQIKDCALLIPIISANTQSRTEGYFRLEWRLADQRTHLMAKGRPFLLPVVIDATRDTDAQVPDSFTEVQWTKLPGGVSSPIFAERVKKLLGGAASEDRGQRTEVRTSRPIPSGRSNRRAWLVPAILGVAALGAVLLWQPWESSATQTTKTATVVSPAAELVAKARALIDDDPLVVRESYKSAVELCERATQLSPDDGEAWATLARANHRLATEYREDTGKRRAALRSQAERAIRLTPDSIEAGLAMAGYELSFEDNVVAARARLLRLIERAPTDRRLLRMLVSLEEDRGQDVPEARRWTERANALPGGDAGTLLSLAWVHWGRNEFPQVREAVEKSLAIQPMTESCQLRLLLFNQSGDFEGARRFLREMPAAILREDRTAMIGYEVQLFSGDYDGALRTITAVPREILEEGLFFSARGYLAGNVLLLAGKTNAARVEFEAALKALDERLAETPRDSRIAYLRAMVLARLGENAKAEQQFATARELGRDEWYEPDVCVLLGRIDDALASFARTIDRTKSRWPGRFRYLKYDPMHEPLRRTARGREIIARGDLWLAEMLRPGASAAPAVALPDAKSVAVLAFANLSDDKANEYFSDGISEELLNVLGRVPGLRVAAPMSAFSFKGKNVSAQEIGQKLNVAYLVNGSVRRAGPDIRVVARLSRADTDEQIWTEKFDGEAKNVFALQDEIAAKIAAALSLKLGASTRTAKPIDPEAHRLYLEGRHFWSLRTFGGFDRAEAALKQAVALEPESALIRAGLAELYATRGWYRAQNVLNPGDNFALASAEAERAIALDPENAQAILARATIAIARQQSVEAAPLLQRVLTLAPNDSGALNRLGDLMVQTGRLDAAVENYQRAMQLDPLSVYLVRDVVRQLGYARRYRDLIDTVDRFEAGSARDWRMIVWRAQALVHMGKTDQATAELRAVLPSITPDDFSSSGASMAELVFSLRGAKCEPESGALAKQLLDRHRPGTYLPAMVLAARGQMDEALPLMVPFPVGSEGRLFWSAIFDPVRDDPRFLRKIDEFGVTANYKVARETLARMLLAQGAKK